MQSEHGSGFRGKGDLDACIKLSLLCFLFLFFFTIVRKGRGGILVSCSRGSGGQEGTGERQRSSSGRVGVCLFRGKALMSSLVGTNQSYCFVQESLLNSLAIRSCSLK